MTPRVVTISVGGVATPAVCCDGIDDGRRRVVCGELRTRPGRCRHCGHVMSDADFTAALGRPDRWATVEAGEAAA